MTNLQRWMLDPKKIPKAWFGGPTLMTWPCMHTVRYDRGDVFPGLIPCPTCGDRVRHDDTIHVNPEPKEDK